MRRLARLDVSIDMTVHLLLLWLLCAGCFGFIFENDRFGCLSARLLYVFDVWQEFLHGSLGPVLGLVVFGVAGLEMRANSRPWFKRLLRLSGPLFITSLLLPFLIQALLERGVRF